MRRIIAQARKELTQLFRDRLTVALALVLALIIPEHFARDLERGQNADVQILVDATDANTANIMRGTMAALTQSFMLGLRPAGFAPPIRAEMRLWYNPGRESQKFIGPGVLAVGLALFPPLLAALAMSREGEQKTILQVYVSSITAHEFLLGKVFAYFTIAIAEWALLMIMGMTLFGLRIAGDPTPLLVS